MVVDVALVQLECSSAEPVYERVQRTFALVRQAAQDAQVVILPELWHVGAFDLDAAREHAQPIDGPLVTDLGALAASLGIWLHAGSFTEIGTDGRHYNTSTVFGPDGNLLVTYRKIHLFGFQGGESVLMSPGEELVVVDTPLGPTGLATCYDLRFPELFRALTAGGAHTVVMCSGWPRGRIGHWDVLTAARAIENQAWVLACNEVGEQPGIVLGGHSRVISPQGEVIAAAGDSEMILFASIEPDDAVQWRTDFPVLDDIRLA